MHKDLQNQSRNQETCEEGSNSFYGENTISYGTFLLFYDKRNYLPLNILLHQPLYK
jgi:hypothetical protein